jgi:predicted N-formylglutamate amidohydrolase
MQRFAGDGDSAGGGFAAVEDIAGRAEAGVLFICDHASNALPPEYGTLGLAPAEFERHIAYDIGAAEVTRALALHFGAPALLTCFSRLLIDANRGGDDPTLVMRISDGSIIPGNARVDEAEIERRKRLYWQAYRDAVRRRIDEMSAVGPMPAIVSLHSFTPLWRNQPRPWKIGLLWDRDARLAAALLKELESAGHENVGDNEPYDGALVGDTLYELGTERGLAHVLIELRQDLIATPVGAQAWAEQLAGPLANVLARPEMHAIEFYGSRAGNGPRRSLTGRS